MILFGWEDNKNLFEWLNRVVVLLLENDGLIYIGFFEKMKEMMYV